MKCTCRPADAGHSRAASALTALAALTLALTALPALAFEPPPAVADAASAPFAANAAPVRVPDSATLTYQVTGQTHGLSYNADAQLQWRPRGNRYDAVWQINLPLLLGARTQHSEGKITAAGLEPERFTESSRGERVAQFDAKDRRIRFNPSRPEAVLQPGAQDRLSITLQFAALMAAAPERYPPGAKITLQTVGVRHADPWVWEVLSDQTLQLAGRSIPCVRLLRQPVTEHDTRVELWLARTLDYLPVRLRLTQNGDDVADQQLQTIDRAPDR